MTEQLRIVGVKLVDESMQTYQELHDQDKTAYPVMIYLSRAVDPFEAKSLRKQVGIIISDDDPMTALIPHTAIDALKTQIAQWNGRIATAAGLAHQARDAAVAEDQRRRQVEAELNAQLRE